jgi:citrate lyase beta subunit
MKRTFSPDSLHDIEARLEQAQKAFRLHYPGENAGRQPVHVVYGGANLFKSGIVRRLGDLALRSMDEYAPDFVAFAKAFELPGAEKFPGENDAERFARTVYERVREKLQREPVEDLRIDFEDGYGIRPDEEEDGHAAAAASELAQGMNLGELPPFIGIRVKAFSAEHRKRAIRTLDIFLTKLAGKTRGELPGHFCITLPKVAMPEEVAALADICTRIEPMLDLKPGALRIELMIERTQAIFNERGEANLLALVNAARGRCVAVQFGPYDYTASRRLITHRPLEHFASDFAREVMQVSLAGTDVSLGDGPTNIMPIPPHRLEKTEKDGHPLTAQQREENLAAVHLGWRIHFQNVRRSLANGFYQGWDLHPAQLPARYGAVYSFFLENIDSMGKRLRNFVDQAAQATRIGQVFDDAAMAQGLMNFFQQGIVCGAITPEDAHARTGLSLAEIRAASFAKIIEGRS